MAKVGRPSDYTPELGSMICDRMAEGESLRTICAEDGMPRTSTVGKWRAAHPEFDSQYTHARQLAGDAEADLAKQYSEQTHVLLPNGMYAAIDPQRARLMADTAKWRAARLAPKGWGDKQFIEHSGNVTFSDAADEELVDLLKELLLTGRARLPEGAQLVEDTEGPADPQGGAFDHEDLA